MDQSKVREIVEAHLADYQIAFGIPHWRITVWYDHELDSTGRVNLQPEYDQCGITLNYTELEDDEMVLRVLRHEMFHIVNSPQKTFCDAVAAFFNSVSEPAAWAVLNSIYALCNERTVKHLERMYIGMCEMQVTKNELPNILNLIERTPKVGDIWFSNGTTIWVKRYEPNDTFTLVIDGTEEIRALGRPLDWEGWHYVGSMQESHGLN